MINAGYIWDAPNGETQSMSWDVTVCDTISMWTVSSLFEEQKKESIKYLEKAYVKLHSGVRMLQNNDGQKKKTPVICFVGIKKNSLQLKSTFENNPNIR